MLPTFQFPRTKRFSRDVIENLLQLRLRAQLCGRRHVMSNVLVRLVAEMLSK